MTLSEYLKIVEESCAASPTGLMFITDQQNIKYKDKLRQDVEVLLEMVKRLVKDRDQLMGHYPYKTDINSLIPQGGEG